MAKRKTDAEFKKQVYELVGNEYTFLDSYVNARTKINVKHNKCGNIYEVQPCVFLQGHGCPYCYDARKTNTQFQQEVYNLVGNEYVFLNSYVNNRTKLRVKHNKCGNIYEVRPSSFLKGNRCPYCSSRARGRTQRKTNVQFKQEVKNLVGDEYTFLDTYVNANTKIRVEHNKCGNIYEVTPSNFLHGIRCPQCAVKSQKKTDAQFKKEVKNLIGDEYKFLDSYQDAHTKLKVKHTKCGNTYEVKPNAFLSGYRCPFCNGGIKKTDTQFKQEVYDLVGGEYTFLDDYINTHAKLRVKHNKCGQVYKVKPNSFLRGTRCPYCAGYIKKTDTQFKQEVFELVGGEYTFLDSYINTKTKLRVEHNKCGNVYKVRPTEFISQHHRCPYCSGKMKKTNARFKQEVYDLVGGEYVFLDTYVNAHTKIGVKHNKCGHIYEVTPANFLKGYRCPYCNNPKGEVIINKILKSLKIKHEYQKTFDDLKDKSYLSYDFFIPNQNILIEYQGIQHYQPIDYFGGNATFKYQQKHDQMKLDYAKDNGYNLIAVPYTEDTFSKIKKYLVKHGLEQHLKSTPKRNASFCFTLA